MLARKAVHYKAKLKEQKLKGADQLLQLIKKQKREEKRQLSSKKFQSSKFMIPNSELASKFPVSNEKKMFGNLHSDAPT